MEDKDKRIRSDEMTSAGNSPEPKADSVRKTSLKACVSLTDGNATESPFPLSIFGAWMLRNGIEKKAHEIRQAHASGAYDAHEAWYCVGSPIKEATKLRAWMVQMDPDYLEGSINSVDALLKEMDADRKRYYASFREGWQGGEEPPSEASLEKLSKASLDELPDTLREFLGE